jgi:hypothetical protein
MNLARLAVALVREFGGVLEHPAGSTLWKAQKLPRPGERDQYGGWTLEAPQKWWGHKAEKATLTRRLTPSRHLQRRIQTLQQIQK